MEGGAQEEGERKTRSNEEKVYLFFLRTVEGIDVSAEAFSFFTRTSSPISHPHTWSTNPPSHL